MQDSGGRNQRTETGVKLFLPAAQNKQPEMQTNVLTNEC